MCAVSRAWSPPPLHIRAYPDWSQESQAGLENSEKGGPVGAWGQTRGCSPPPVRGEHTRCRLAQPEGGAPGDEDPACPLSCLQACLQPFTCCAGSELPLTSLPSLPPSEAFSSAKSGLRIPSLGSLSHAPST